MGWKRWAHVLPVVWVVLARGLWAQPITTVAGNGTFSYSGDGGTATSASLAYPSGVALDRQGNLFVADQYNYRIRRVDGVTGEITTVAGNGIQSFSGDGGVAVGASLDSPYDVAIDGAGNLFIVDQYNHRIRRVDGVTGVITTVAGNGSSSYGGDGGAAVSASLAWPTGVAVDGAGNLFIADQGNRRIRRVDGVTGVISTVAGNGTSGYSGDGGAATSAGLDAPYDVVVDAGGNLLISDYYHHRIRRVDGATGVITTVAGDGNSSYGGDGGAATAASLYFPTGLALDAAGNLFIADHFNHRIRRMDGATGVITTVAGNGSNSYGGDGGAATSASLLHPTGVAVDGVGILYIADQGNNRVRRVDGVAATTNRVPVADAGPDQRVVAGSAVTLDGSASADANSDSLRYHWTAPAGAVLADSTAVQPVFLATTAGFYSFVLTVHDGTVASAPDTMLVIVQAPADMTVPLPGGATMDFRWIPSGTFTMGDEGLGETPHEVTLTQGFFLGQYEITQAQWQSVMGSAPWAGMSYAQDRAGNPATYVSWLDVQRFVHQLNVAAGDSLYRLPSEAEWEYACRAGTTTEWSFGSDVSQLGRYAWYSDNAWSVGEAWAHPVGTKLPNPWGLYDMHGNVYEWVQDLHGTYPSEPQTNPMGPASGDSRVVRGGYFIWPAGSTASAARYQGYAHDAAYSVGARIVRLAAPPVAAWSVGLSIVNAQTQSQTLSFGVAYGGSDGLDAGLGENELPPAPPGDTFDARWLAPFPLGGLESDYRSLETQTTGATWTLAVLAPEVELPVTLTWDRTRLPAEGVFQLVDAGTNGGVVNVSMRTNGHYEVTTPGQTLLQVRYRPAETFSHSYDLPARWSLVSLPVSLADSSLEAVLPSAQALFGFSGTYGEAVSFAAGTGYWANLTAPTQVTVTGPAHPDGALVRSLPSHWSLVGLGVRAVDVTALKASCPQIVSVYGYSGGYHQAATMEPGNAYWVNLSTAAEVDLSGRVAPAGKALVAPPPWASTLWAEGATGRQAITLGVNDGEVVALPPIPPAELFDVRVELPGGTATLQVPSADGAWPIRLQGGVEQLRWQVPAGSGWSLQIGDTVTRLSGGGQIAVNAGDAIVLRHDGAMPLLTALKGAYPNPFNPATTLHYELAEAAQVQLRVYAVSGQLVRELVAAHQEAGAYRVEWDGRDASGAAVGNGVYLGVLQAGDFRAVTRMVLMK